MVDNDEADDKIIAVLENDNIWGAASDIGDIPSVLTERISHYFSTYKYIFGQDHTVVIEQVLGASHAHAVILAAIADYGEEFGE